MHARAGYARNPKPLVTVGIVAGVAGLGYLLYSLLSSKASGRGLDLLADLKSFIAGTPGADWWKWRGYTYEDLTEDDLAYIASKAELPAGYAIKFNSRRESDKPGYTWYTAYSMLPPGGWGGATPSPASPLPAPVSGWDRV